MPSLEEAAKELRMLIQTTDYDSAATSEQIARQQAYLAGQLHVIAQLDQMYAKYMKGGSNA